MSQIATTKFTNLDCSYGVNEKIAFVAEYNIELELFREVAFGELGHWRGAGFLAQQKALVVIADSQTVVVTWWSHVEHHQSALFY